MKVRLCVAIFLAVGCVQLCASNAWSCVSGAVRPPAAQLLPNHPNPFNPNTTIRFVLPAQMRVTIVVHDVSGRVVAKLIDEVRERGAHNITWNAQGLASGVYFAHMRTGNTDVSRKMVLLK